MLERRLAQNILLFPVFLEQYKYSMYLSDTVLLPNLKNNDTLGFLYQAGAWLDEEYVLPYSLLGQTTDQ